MADDDKRKRKLWQGKQYEAGKNANASTGTGASAVEQGMGKMRDAVRTASEAFADMKTVNPLRSVGIKLFLLIFLSILACVLTIGLASYNEARSMVEKKVSQSSLQTVSQIAINLDTLLKTYEDISMQLLIDRDFHSYVWDAAESEDFSKYEAIRKLTEKIQSYPMGNNTIKGIALLPLKDDLRVITAGSSLPSKAEEVMKSEWFAETKALSGRTNWIAPQPEGMLVQSASPMLGLSRLLNDSVMGTASYMLLIEIDTAALTAIYEQVTLGENSEFSIVDASGNYVIAGETELNATKARYSLPETDELQASPKLTTTDGVEVLASYRKLSAVEWKLVGTIPVGELVKDANAIRNLTWVTALAAIVLAIAIGAVVILTIARPLVKLCNLMIEGAQGNLTVRSTLRQRRDEIGGLSDSFNRMMEQITELALRTTRSAEEVLATTATLTDASRKTSLSAKEISIATEQIASGATSLAVEAEKGNDLTTHINAQMKAVMEANAEMVGSAADVQRASGQGTAYMGTLIEKTSLTEEMTRSMVEKVDSLKESTGSIVKILDVLNGLTKQTNILSLNATIEAARAGAAGKGFMVVADEIRKLADQSRQSIDVVAQITGGIQTEIDETVQVLSEAYPLFQEQIASVKEANGIFVSVQAQMGRFVNKLDSVTQSVGELDQSQAVLATAMGNVSAVAEQSSATSEEVASLSSEQLSISEGLVRLSEQLDAVSQGLKTALSQFKI